MFSEKRSSDQYTIDDMISQCQSKWGGKGGLPHFFSPLEWERFRVYAKENALSSTERIALPLFGTFSSEHEFFLTDAQKIFGYLPWKSTEPNNNADARVYMERDSGTSVDHILNDTPIFCQSKLYHLLLKCNKKPIGLRFPLRVM